MNSARIFFNYSNKDFTAEDGAKWDGVGYCVKAGEKMMLQDFIAQHFAEHLTMREMNRENKDALINRESSAFQTRCLKALPEDEVVEAETPEKLEMAMKAPKKSKKKEVEEEFPELKSKK
jgi:DUF1009 family protein